MRAREAQQLNRGTVRMMRKGDKNESPPVNEGNRSSSSFVNTASGASADSQDGQASLPDGGRYEKRCTHTPFRDGKAKTLRPQGAGM